MKEIFEKGSWLVEYELNDGARLSRLCYRNFNLLTTAPNHFKPPSMDYGKYETRPVYGYDDCFPSVEVSTYPGKIWKIPDHGELCWLQWDVEVQPDRLIFSVESRVLPVIFKRILHFGESELKWTFEAKNTGVEVLPFQHVTHPLIKLDDITNIQLPSFKSVNNESGLKLDLNSPGAVRNYLLSTVTGNTHMLFIQKAEEGKIRWTYNNKLQLEMRYPLNLFPAIGIWWNNFGYPDEDGCRRNECAFEPIPGTSSTLSEAHDEGLALFARPGKTFLWEINWNVIY